MVRHCCVLHIFTSKCASRHNAVHFLNISTSKSVPNVVCFARFDLKHFLNISTSKSAPNMWCFAHFDFQMCFAPQRRSLFRHVNWQKCSGREVFLMFSLPNVLRATMACNFSFLIGPDGSAPTALASLLATNHWKDTMFCDFCTFSCACIFFFWLFLFSADLLSSSFLFPDSSHLCFSICP